MHTLNCRILWRYRCFWSFSYKVPEPTTAQYTVRWLDERYQTLQGQSYKGENRNAMKRKVEWKWCSTKVLWFLYEIWLFTQRCIILHFLRRGLKSQTKQQIADSNKHNRIHFAKYCRNELSDEQKVLKRIVIRSSFLAYSFTRFILLLSPFIKILEDIVYCVVLDTIHET